MLRLLLAALLVALAPAQGSSPPAPTPPTAPSAPSPNGGERIPCTACDGAGRAQQTCWVCGGDGEHACGACRPGTFRVRGARWRSSWTPAALWRLEQERFDATMGALGKIADVPFPGEPANAPRRAERKPGEILCPAGCRGGKHVLVDEWVDCKLCRSGKFRCGWCRRGELSCRPCAGTGRRVEACPDCAGNGWLPDAAPALRAPLRAASPGDCNVPDQREQEELRRAIERELKGELRRLDKLLKAARKAAREAG